MQAAATETQRVRRAAGRPEQHVRHRCRRNERDRPTIAVSLVRAGSDAVVNSRTAGWIERDGWAAYRVGFPGRAVGTACDVRDPKQCTDVVSDAVKNARWTEFRRLRSTKRGWALRPADMFE